MKQAINILTLLLTSINLFSQTTYTGFIDKYPIELVTYIYGDGDAKAIYAYTNFEEPIAINGTLKKNKLNLFEKDKSGKNKATLTFDNFFKFKTAKFKAVFYFCCSFRLDTVSRFAFYFRVGHSF